MAHADFVRIDPAYRDTVKAAHLDRVEDVLTREAGTIAAWSRTTDTLFVPGAGERPGFYVKRYYYPHWRNRLRGMFRGTYFGMHRGQAEYRSLNIMRSLGIAAVRPVAFGARRIAHFVAACFLITEEVPDARNLTSFAAEVVSGRRALEPKQRATMTEHLARQVAAMHAAGFAHGQLFWRNIVVRMGPDDTPEFFFLDAQPPRHLLPNRGDAWWLRDLAPLAASALPFTTRSQRIRFLRHYFGVPRLTPAIKAYAHEIGMQMGQWCRHEAHRIKMDDLLRQWQRQLELESPWTGAGAAAAADTRSGRGPTTGLRPAETA